MKLANDCTKCRSLCIDYTVKQ